MDQNNKINGASQTLKILEQNGVTDIFGYPGGAIMPIYDALYDSKINHYLCRHEQGAAFAAIGYARASGKVGVCMATSGPGATNLITGLADAMADSIPLVAITGQVSTKVMGSDAFQEIDVIGLSFACTKHSFQVKDINELEYSINTAFKLALSGRPGPVLIDIAKDVQLAKSGNFFAEKNLELATNLPKEQSTDNDNDNDYNEAIRLLTKSKKPVFYIGGGVSLANAVEELRALMLLVNAPSVCTLKALGSVDLNNQYYLGMLGMHGTKAANLVVQQSDLLIVIGARFDDRATGKLSEFAPFAKVIQMDIDKAEFNKNRAVNVCLAGDLKLTLKHFLQTIKRGSFHHDRASWLTNCQQLSKQNQPDYQHPAEGIYAPALLNQLSDINNKSRFNRDTIVTTDVGQHQMWTALHMLFDHPKNFISSCGLGTMGFGLPAAIGAQISRPKDQVIAITGDGSLMMNIQELATIKRFQLPIKILLLDNARLGLVRQWQQLFFKERYSETDLSDNPDFVCLANSFEITAKCITHKNQVNQAISEMLNHQGPYLLQAKIDELENVWPLVPPETANHKMLESV